MTTPTKDAYRPHLDGIRAVAVILVILFHLGYEWIPGGFVGVDVFFVLSGYLITGLLVDELVRNGRVDLARFYARRVRRLLPAAVLVVAVVVVATAGLLDRVGQAQVGRDATYSALYGANWHFGLVSGDYFAPGDVPSPLIHFWSLAVEEQFYVVWPAVLIGLWSGILWRRRGARGIDRLLAGVLVMIAVSAALSVLLAPGPLTYYGTHTRAYQLLAGAALAIGARRWAARPPGAPDASARLAATGFALGIGALAALALLAHRISDAQGYPGPAALGVTVATVVLIAALDLMGSHPLRRLAGASLPAAVGRLSYSLYLWHWPTIVLLPLLADRHDVAFVAQKPALVAAMTLLALISYRLWEQPIRFRVRRRAPARRVVVAGVAASLAMGASTIALLQAPSAFEGRALAAVTDLAKPGGCPYFARDWSAATATRACVRRRGSGLKVALVGDSHAQQWEPALEVLAERYDLSVIRATRGGCPANDVTVDRDADVRGVSGSGEACTAWRREVYPDLVQRHDPDVVFVATRSHVSPLLDDGRRIEPSTREHRRLWSARWDWTLDTLSRGGARVVVSRILPTLPQRVPACLADAGRPTPRCDFPVRVDGAVHPYNAAIDRLADRARRVTAFDPTPIGCPQRSCPALAGDIVVHRDDNHLSAAYVRSRANGFRAALDRAGAALARAGAAPARARP
ncbi:MAG: acyltransferase family protein [Thermoleophilia bacterium]